MTEVWIWFLMHRSVPVLFMPKTFGEVEFARPVHTEGLNV